LLWHEYFTFGHAELKPEMLAALLCEEMKWTYQEYRAQPAWFVIILIQMMQERTKAAERRNKP